jgi:hypothetical protein
MTQGQAQLLNWEDQRIFPRNRSKQGYCRNAVGSKDQQDDRSHAPTSPSESLNLTEK